MYNLSVVEIKLQLAIPGGHAAGPNRRTKMDKEMEQPTLTLPELLKTWEHCMEDSCIGCPNAIPGTEINGFCECREFINRATLRSLRAAVNHKVETA